MKKRIMQILIMSAMVSMTHTGFAQCVSWLELSSPNPYADGAWGVTTDASNNVYTTGLFHGSISFGNDTLVNPTGGASFYVNKFNENGNLVWAMQLPVKRYSLPPVLCQKNGIVYVAGAFADTITLGPNQITTISGHHALFIMKLDLDGNILGYIPVYGGNGSSYASVLGITVNSLDEIHITGRLSGDYTFGTVLLNNEAGSYAFLAKLKQNLNTIWAIQSTSTAGIFDGRGWGITLDNTGNIVIGGYFMNEIQFGSRSLSANNHIGGRNPYIAKFDSAGNCQWIRGGTGSQLFSTVYTVVCDNDANVYYTANLDSTLTIELNTLQTSDGLFYYCKYTSDGNLVWVHQAGNSSFNGGEASSSLVIDASNIMWNSGWINGPATFGVFTLPGMSSYIAKLDLDGTFLGAIGGTGIGSNYQSVLDGAGNLYLGGAAFGDTISFDGNTLVNADDTLGVDFLLRFCTPELGITPAVLDKEQISLFPDPTSGKFTLRLNNSGNTTEKFRLDIVNVLGSSLYSTTIQPGTDEVIDLSGSDPGIYLVKLTNGKRTFSRKLILQ